MRIRPAAGAALEAAAAELARGSVVAIPTDTVYGLAVAPLVQGATERLFALKRRPSDVAVPVLVADVAQATRLSEAFLEGGAAALLARRWWPGALTIVVPRRTGVHIDLGGGYRTIGVRCPDHVLVRALCRRAGPLAVTSANLHGEEEARSAEQVAEAFGEGVALVLDGGECSGRPSTVVDCSGTEPRCLREGALAWADLGL